MTFKKSNKSTNSAFKRDLALGNEIEHKILQSVRKKYPSAVLIPGKFKPYDIFIALFEFSMEDMWKIVNMLWTIMLALHTMM